MWARNQAASRWKALVLLGVLVGIGRGLALSALAGARRTETAYERFRAATGRSDAIVFGTQLGVFNADYSRVRALPEVADAGEFALAPIGLKEFPGVGSLPPNDDHLYRTINRPLLIAGRLPDPARPDEILVNRRAASLFHLRVGARVTLISARDINAFFGTAPLAGGPAQRATIVGVGDSNMDFVFGVDDATFIPSAAFLGTHPEIPRAPNLVVRLRPGTDVDAFRAHVASVMHLPAVPVRDQSEDTKRITHGTDLERTALLLLAASVVLACAILAGQALSRTVHAAAEFVPTLRALGFTRGGLIGALTLPLSISAIAGTLTSFAVAVSLSDRFPVGLAGRVEPDHGFHLDRLVLGLGAAAVVVLVGAAAAVAAFRATRPAAREGSRAGSPIVRALRKVAPLPAAIGAGLALERGSGRRALPRGGALAGAVASMLGLVASFGLLAGIDRALTQRDLSGQVWSVDVFVDQSHSAAQLMDALARETGVAVIATQRRVELEVEGAGLPVYALTLMKGNQSFIVLSGRGPASPDEIVLGTATARALKKRIGDTVAVKGIHAIAARVVGLGLLPQTPHSSFDQGGWMSSSGLDALAPPPTNALEAEVENTIEARFAPGRSTSTVVGRLQKALGGNADIEPEPLPQDVLFLRNVRTLPRAFACFLALLGVSAVAHILVTTVLRRRHDMAVLRALGFRSSQVASCFLAQAGTIAFVGIVVGIPFGVVAGRWSWRWVADVTPLRYVAPVATSAIALSIPAALLLSNAIAALPARRATRIRPAEVLRTE
jgi:ABC-type lipoprotein release transport system permease subunit